MRISVSDSALPPGIVAFRYYDRIPGCLSTVLAIPACRFGEHTPYRIPGLCVHLSSLAFTPCHRSPVPILGCARAINILGHTSPYLALSASGYGIYRLQSKVTSTLGSS
jgi:hypothetical protein